VNARLANLLPCAGFVLGPGAWAANTQASQFLPIGECQAGTSFSLALTGVCMLCALAGAALSLEQWRLVGRSPARRRSAYPRSFEFVSAVGAFVGVVVAFALLLQGLAPLTVPPCLS
jgi:hypothetical protein